MPDTSLLVHESPTPAGSLTVLLRPAANGDEVVVAAGFTTAAVLRGRLGITDEEAIRTTSSAAIGEAVKRWIDGDLDALASLVLDQAGTDFQDQVWRALAKVPAGTTATYAQLAAAVGRPDAARAVGSACGHNLIAPFVPCHRAVRGDGGLGGYAWGLEVKRWLLAHEAAHA